ncbi:MAG: hypothetical protein H6632_21500 [Anaerolineales bacterium]|nr:hypothetical protein [Anaerolineales bacterium]
MVVLYIRENDSPNPPFASPIPRFASPIPPFASPIPTFASPIPPFASLIRRRPRHNQPSGWPNPARAS